MSTAYDFTANRLDGSPFDLGSLRGQVSLVVNVASQCGFTPQYTALEQLQQRYHARGFNVLGFPCNQFRQQEPGDAQAIAEFCSTRFSVTFPMFAKIDVNGAGAHPLYVWLKQARPGLLGTTAIKWNFTKFLVGRDGQVVARYAPTTDPLRIAQDIEAQLARGASA